MYQVLNNQLIQNPHPGQLAIFNSTSRITAAIAGTQSGKTVIGPHWIIDRLITSGPGDRIIATPSFPLLNLKALPEFRRIFEDILHLGKYFAQSRVFRLSPFGERKMFGDSGHSYNTSIFFGHAQDPESLESATAKDAWLDEAGQKKFKLGSYEAIMRRLSIHQGRLLITTTPYSLNWLKTKIWDKRSEPHISCINFKSIMNPTFSLGEYERARSELPKWKFDMFYNGLFTRPAGAIFDCFDDRINTQKRFPIPEPWPRYCGIDYGAVNTAAVLIARDPNTPDSHPKYYCYATYKAGSKSFAGHAKDINSTAKLGQDTPKMYTMGGAPSESQERLESRKGGLRVHDPKLASVEVGIDRVYASLKLGELIFFDDLQSGSSVIEDMDVIDQIRAYSRKLNENDQPTEDIEDKNRFHLVDATRYIVGGKLYRRKRVMKSDSTINLNQ